MILCFTDALRKESPEYITMVEDNDDIQALSNDERLTLCGSILATQYFQSKNIEFDLVSTEDTSERDIYIKTLPLNSFKGISGKYVIFSDNVLCKALDSTENQSVDYYYTRSYRNDNSVFFLNKVESTLYFDSYFKNIPALINSKRNAGIVV